MANEMSDTIARFKTGALKALTVGVLLLILQPFFIPLALAMVFSALLLPLQLKDWKRVKSPAKKAALLAVGFTLLIVLPIVTLLGAGILVMKNNLQKTPEFFNQLMSEKWLQKLTSGDSILAPVRQSFGLTDESLHKYFEMGLQKFQTYAMAFLESAVMSAPAVFLSFFVMVLALFWILKDWAPLRDWAFHHSFLNRPGTTELLNTFRGAATSVVLAGALSGTVQSIILATGAWASGVANPAVVMVVTFFSSFFPLIGTGLVSVTLIVFTLVTGTSEGNLTWFVIAAGLASVADNVVYPTVMGGRNQLNPLLSFLAVVGGIEIFGLFGIFLGPIAMMMSLKAYQLISAREERDRKTRSRHLHAEVRLHRPARSPALDV